ncbi:Cell division protein FtsW [uncultured Candidatus Thioglobus sp.]|nr:Cell division protein FtsW [uncultured Candidatus Thioglobus sp.]
MFDKTEQFPDKKLLLIILALLAFGWIMSSSASVGHFGDFSKTIKQGGFILVGISIGFFVLKLPLHLFKKYADYAFVLTLILLAIVLLPDPIGRTVNGSRRWINLVYFGFQPSEMMKLVMILFMAKFLVTQEKEVASSWIGLVKAAIIVGLAGLLIMLETDLGATVIITATALIMLFLAGSYIKQLFIIGSGLLTLVGVYVYFDPVRLYRLMSFWTNDLWGENGVLQTRQALIGIARGDWTGVGLGAGIQKYSRLPEPHTDMIFAITGEELGIMGMLFILFAFVYALNRGFNIAAQALTDGRKYSYYVAYGICTWFALQISVNIAMNIGLFPIKGYTLPLISYGGSSMIFSIIALALLLRIDMENKTNYKKRKHYV